MDDVSGLLRPADQSALIDALTARGYTVLAPVRQGDALTVAPVTALDQVARGWTADQTAGTYRLRRRDDARRFATTPAALPWKRVLHPPEAHLWTARDTGNGFEMISKPEPPPKQALLGLLPCDLAAIARQDKVFDNGTFADPVYTGRRENALLIAATCAQAGDTCFCAAMETGPDVRSPCDIALTELDDDAGWLVEARSGKGAEILSGLPLAPVPDTAFTQRDAIAEATAAAQIRTLPADTPGLLHRHLDHPHWQAVADRCLSCGNCTNQCPTCFCSNTEDVTSLDGTIAERRRVWDSCFSLDFTYATGRPLRQSTESRYRQWITHKLSTWHDQFGESGCIGCGRCITWCPVGIDITEEAAALAALEDAAEAAHA
ncbi:Ferredoxin [Caenispirillum salinarum AK4]|uniref:Ferredoxin n=1 Tax=Caenispirillum salinarum AK4 TaxID=1238182 RepID=K9H153_9PROT|nr:4Fe-4S dicluster domain-containing protein [Caenispirillum salinarum]EKV30774.1 Ferredoxin [Caenispirillum salinarum AK4]